MCRRRGRNACVGRYGSGIKTRGYVTVAVDWGVGGGFRVHRALVLGLGGGVQFRGGLVCAGSVDVLLALLS